MGGQEPSAHAHRTAHRHGSIAASVASATPTQSQLMPSLKCVDGVLSPKHDNARFKVDQFSDPGLVGGPTDAV